MSNVRLFLPISFYEEMLSCSRWYLNEKKSWKFPTVTWLGRISRFFQTNKWMLLDANILTYRRKIELGQSRLGHKNQDNFTVAFNCQTREDYKLRFWFWKMQKKINSLIHSQALSWLLSTEMSGMTKKSF